jgi:hypothetical protein
MSNIRFHYLYRDVSNYKKWTDIVFLNPDDLATEIARKGCGPLFWKTGYSSLTKFEFLKSFSPQETSLRPMTTVITNSIRSRAHPTHQMAFTVAQLASSWSRFQEKPIMVGGPSIPKTGWFYEVYKRLATATARLGSYG